MAKQQRSITMEDAEIICKSYEINYGTPGPTPDEVIRVLERMDDEIGEYVRTTHKKMDEQEEEQLKKKIKILFQKLLKELRKYKPMPTSAAINSIIDAINAGQNGQQRLDEWLTRKNRIGHTKDTVTCGEAINKEEGKIIFQHNISGERGYVKLKMPDSIFNGLGYSVAPKKIMTFLFEKINTQAFHNGQLTRDYVDFSASELVERGVYTTRQSALRGLKAAMNILTGIQIEGEYHFGPDTISYTSSNEGGNIFRFWQHDKGQWRVYIEEHADWRFILRWFSILPQYYYRLPYRASELLYLIFTLARQNTKDIKERGYFTISFRLIQQMLNLPDEDKTKNPQRDIKDVINSTINKIDKAQQEDFGNEDLLFLSAEYNEAWPMKQFLNEGFLHVALSGAFAKPFIDIEDEKTKKLQEIERKKQKAIASKKDSNNQGGNILRGKKKT